MPGLPLLLAACIVGGDGRPAGDTDVRPIDEPVDPGIADTAPPDSGGGCEARTGGARITFGIAGEVFTGWFTDAAFVYAAEAHLAAGTAQVPVFGQVLRGTDCDPRWSFHVDPADAVFADVTVELCDAAPSHVDGHLEDWIFEVGAWCPWSAVVTSIDRR